MANHLIWHHVSYTLLVLLLVTGCASAPPLPNGPAQTAVVNYALSLDGAPYRYGKASPEEGFDCSGFVRYVYQHQGIVLPRTARAMADALPQIPSDNILAGDLLFFDIGGRPYSHVGIYVDQGKFIHAPSRHAGKVMVSRLTDHYWQRCYSGVRRPLALR